MGFWNWLRGGGRKKKPKPLATSAGASSPSAKPTLPVSKPIVTPALVWNPPMVTSEFCGWADPNPYYHDFPGLGMRLITTGTEAPFHRPWEALRTRNRVPAIGEYDEQKIEVERWRLQQMVAGNLDVACKQVGWSHMRAVKAFDWLPPYDPLLYRWTVDNHMAIPNSGVKFCLSNWFSPEGTDDGPVLFAALIRDNKWDSDDLRLSMKMYAQSVGKIMQHPDYWRLDDKPVLYRGWAHTLPWYSEHFGFDVTAQEVVSIWKEEIKKLVGVEPYLVATSMDPAYHKHLKEWGFSALTQYLLHGKGWADTMNIYRGWWRADLATCRAQGIGYIVPITAGYDGEAWDTEEHRKGVRHIPTAAEFEAHVREGRKLARDNQDICRAVGSYAWSEFGEGGILEPMQSGMLHDGDEMIRAHARACA